MAENRIGWIGMGCLDWKVDRKGKEAGDWR